LDLLAPFTAQIEQDRSMGGLGVGRGCHSGSPEGKKPTAIPYRSMRPSITAIDAPIQPKSRGEVRARRAARGRLARATCPVISVVTIGFGARKSSGGFNGNAQVEQDSPQGRQARERPFRAAL